MAKVKIVRLGDKTFHLPFLDRIPFDPAQRQQLADSIKEAGRVKLPVVCWKEKSQSHEFVVVDGATRVCIAAEKRFKVPIQLCSYASEEEAAADCDRLNFDRRQSGEELQRAHRAKRVERVAAARAEGQSVRAIAEQEGISQGQAQRDLEKAAGVPPPGTPEQTAEKTGKKSDSEIDTSQVENVAGRDGKTYPAKKKIRCARCTRLNIDQSDCEGCKAAKEAAATLKRRQKKPKQSVAEAADEARAQDEETEPETIEEEIKLKNSVLEKWCRGLMKYAETMPDDPWLQDLNRREGALQKLKNCCETVRSAKCHCACPKCGGDGCGKCHKTGRVTLYAFQQIGA